MKPITQKRAKLTPEQRARLDAEYDAGVPIAVLSARYGCHESYPGKRAKRQDRPVRRRVWTDTVRRLRGRNATGIAEAQ
jgi:hypothetical protein